MQQVLYNSFAAFFEFEISFIKQHLESCGMPTSIVSERSLAASFRGFPEGDNGFDFKWISGLLLFGLEEKMGSFGNSARTVLAKEFCFTHRFGFLAVPSSARIGRVLLENERVVAYDGQIRGELPPL
jgi:hypothetical protein